MKNGKHRQKLATKQCCAITEVEGFCVSYFAAFKQVLGTGQSACCLWFIVNRDRHRNTTSSHFVRTSRLMKADALLRVQSRFLFSENQSFFRKHCHDFSRFQQSAKARSLIPASSFIFTLRRLITVISLGSNGPFSAGNHAITRGFVR